MFTHRSLQNNGSFTISPLSRLIFLVCCWVICFLIGSMIVGVIGYSGTTTAKLRIGMVLQDVVIFILPAIVTAVMITRRPADFLMISRCPKIDAICLVLLILAASAPMMNALIAWNESLTLPDNLTALSNWMRTAEDNARESMAMLIGTPSVGSLIATLLIVAIMAGFSEELFFRGALQRILITYPINKHLAVWLTAFIFSAIHLQFFGFFPRLLLGALFGYLAVWSGNLWLPIVAHIANNAIAGTIMWRMQSSATQAQAINSIGVGTEGHPQWNIVLASAAFTLICLHFLRHRLSRANNPE